MDKEYFNVKTLLEEATAHIKNYDRIRTGIKLATDIISTLGSSVEETHFRTVLEAHIGMAENLFKEELSLEDLLVEECFPTSALDILLRAYNKVLRDYEKMKDRINEFKYLYFSSRPFTSLGREGVEEFVKTAWEKLENIFKEEVELRIDITEKGGRAYVVGNGFVVIGIKEVPVVTDLERNTLHLREFELSLTLAEEFVHVLHYRRIKDYPPLFRNIFSHYSELMAETIKWSVAEQLTDFELDKEYTYMAVVFTLARNLSRQLKDFYLYQGDIGAASEILEKRGVPVHRRDWRLYLEHRAKELAMLVEDPREDLIYRLAEAVRVLRIDFNRLDLPDISSTATFRVYGVK